VTGGGGRGHTATFPRRTIYGSRLWNKIKNGGLVKGETGILRIMGRKEASRNDINFRYTDSGGGMII